MSDNSCHHSNKVVLTEADLLREKKLREGGAPYVPRAKACNMGHIRYREALIDAFGFEWWESVKRTTVIKTRVERVAPGPEELTEGQVRRAKLDLYDGMSLERIAERLPVNHEAIVRAVGKRWYQENLKALRRPYRADDPHHLTVRNLRQKKETA